MSINLKTLIGKLNRNCRQAAERAASLCMARAHFDVEIEHVLLALLEQPGSDFGVYAGRCGVSVGALKADLEAELGRLKTGNTRTPVFSTHLPTWFEHAWLIASLDAHTSRIRSGHLLLALLGDPDLRRLALRASPRLAELGVDALKHRFDEATLGSEEALGVSGNGGPGELPGVAAPAAPAANAGTPALDQFTTHLTRQAAEGRIDPVIGRDAEIRRLIDILLRRRQNNPILTGEAGVGKTAVVEGLALRIASGDVPPPLQGVELRTLDMGLLQAGASVKGEFENRLRNVIDEVGRSARPIILFIDEAHTLIGAGGPAGQGDAANLLKPALARGELRTIAATTWGEYKKYFEKDAALARRFQVVKVEEPSEALAAAMLRGMAQLMEGHFGVRILDEAITEAVRLSHRYITGRQLPDKAVGVLDTACARVALGQSAMPAAIEDVRRKLERNAVEAAALAREARSGTGHGERMAELDVEHKALEGELAVLDARWQLERELVDRIGAMRNQLEEEASGHAAAPDTAQAPGEAGKADSKRAARPDKAPLQSALAELARSQGEAPLVPCQVDAIAVAEVIAAWTGIPLGRMLKDEIETVRNLKPLLEQRVIGQSHALDAIAQRVRTARASLEDPDKPMGVFLFVGPSGVGKTETALALAETLYGGERKLITINMSEYQEAHTVSALKGSPPGYVGYGEGGVLTEAVRRSPYSVVLLDEVEKAHPDVLELFFQVFDKGVLDDAEGREIDFRNTLIILTSNVGSSVIMNACLNLPDAERPGPEELAELLRPQLFKAFKPAFLGRMKTIPFYPITDDVLGRIIRLKLDRIRHRVAVNHRAGFEYDNGLVDAVLARCNEVDAGARNVDHVLNGSLLPEIADAVLARMSEGETLERIRVSAGRKGEFKYRIQ
ncbi:type VI secretion system ATPase TssH [Alkalisalibacterium limincola]|uniref:Type VI secretion system ATPase TssH n=1 Tax=Alkalisalibacterium limincola TaxID=2699169 RepID=A0A5C8KQB8_9GAMM|nr:type VI secretion system ATPase TssH [Alkalisalibacterium limincola]TXK62613.1 type VI secretion system ATPase TssH [Alkalisalibacterium limincola]